MRPGWRLRRLEVRVVRRRESRHCAVLPYLDIQSALNKGSHSAVIPKQRVHRPVFSVLGGPGMCHAFTRQPAERATSPRMLRMIVCREPPAGEVLILVAPRGTQHQCAPPDFCASPFAFAFPAVSKEQFDQHKAVRISGTLAWCGCAGLRPAKPSFQSSQRRARRNYKIHSDGAGPSTVTMKDHLSAEYKTLRSERCSSKLRLCSSHDRKIGIKRWFRRTPGSWLSMASSWLQDCPLLRQGARLVCVCSFLFVALGG